MTSGQIPHDLPASVVMALLKSNISQVFDNLAASMTEQLGTRLGATAEGIILVNEVLVRTEWIWLTLSLDITLTAALFLINSCLAMITVR
jgi:hypothetical protein